MMDGQKQQWRQCWRQDAAMAGAMVVMARMAEAPADSETKAEATAMGGGKGRGGGCNHVSNRQCGRSKGGTRYKILKQINKMHDLMMLVVTFCPLARICPDPSSAGRITINGLLT